ncbi:MAG TPA: hypothetical protein PK808_11265 [Polymorphobacter sp.]|nr:hypothetical protein [Polymorphobacter sp.]
MKAEAQRQFAEQLALRLHAGNAPLREISARTGLSFAALVKLLPATPTQAVTTSSALS